MLHHRAFNTLFRLPGTPSKEQRQRMDALQASGWCVVVCWTWEAAYRTVVGYAAMLRVQVP
jgi:hypothetical protein